MKQQAVNEKNVKLNSLLNGGHQHAEGSVQGGSRQDTGSKLHKRALTKQFKEEKVSSRNQGGIFELAELPFDKKLSKKKQIKIVDNSRTGKLRKKLLNEPSKEKYESAGQDSQYVLTLNMGTQVEGPLATDESEMSLKGITASNTPIQS